MKGKTTFPESKTHEQVTKSHEQVKNKKVLYGTNCVVFTTEKVETQFLTENAVQMAKRLHFAYPARNKKC